MKKYIKNLTFSYLLILTLLLILTTIIVILKYNLNITSKTINIIGLIFSSLIFLLGGIINGKLNKKRGLINGLIMTSIYFMLIIILKICNIPILLSSLIIKSIIIIIGNIIGVNL